MGASDALFTAGMPHTSSYLHDTNDPTEQLAIALKLLSTGFQVFMMSAISSMPFLAVDGSITDSSSCHVFAGECAVLLVPHSGCFDKRTMGDCCGNLFLLLVEICDCMCRTPLTDRDRIKSHLLHLAK